MIIEEGNLKVRPLKLADAVFLYKWLNDPRVLAFYEGRDNPQDMSTITARFFRNSSDDRVDRSMVLWRKIPIGYVQTYLVDAEELSAYAYEYGELGTVYGMDQFIGEPEYWDQGIGTLLVNTVANRLSTNAWCQCVVMDPRVDNPRAIHVYEKCGFKKIRRLPARELHEGVWRDCWLMERRADR